MLKRLKRILREWLVEDDSDELDCLVATSEGLRCCRYLIIGSRGATLIGQRVDGRGNEVRLIRETEARSNKQFWSLWNRHNPGSRLIWEDGTPFRP